MATALDHLSSNPWLRHRLSAFMQRTLRSHSLEDRSSFLLNNAALMNSRWPATYRSGSSGRTDRITEDSFYSMRRSFLLSVRFRTSPRVTKPYTMNKRDHVYKWSIGITEDSS